VFFFPIRGLVIDKAVVLSIGQRSCSLIKHLTTPAIVHGHGCSMRLAGSCRRDAASSVVEVYPQLPIGLTWIPYTSIPSDTHSLSSSLVKSVSREVLYSPQRSVSSRPHKRFSYRSRAQRCFRCPHIPFRSSGSSRYNFFPGLESLNGDHLFSVSSKLE